MIRGIYQLRDEKSTWIREKTKLKDIIQVVKQQKWRWAGHVARMNDNRWTKRITDWHPFNEERSRKGYKVERRDRKICRSSLAKISAR